MARVQSHPAVQAFVADALAEQDFLDFEEPYRKGR
jgi:glutathione S-transferase